MGDIVIFPNSCPSNMRRITAEEFSNLKIFDVISDYDGSRGVYIEGFSSQAESDKFIHDLDDFFLGPLEPTDG